MKKLILVFIALLFVSCSGGGSSHEETQPEIQPPAQEEVQPEVIPEKKPLSRFEFINELNAGTSQRIAIMGTSLSSEQNSTWIFLFEDYLGKYGDLVTIGHFGKSSTDSFYGISILPDVIAFKPDVVFIEYSMNDAYVPFGVSKEEALANLDAIVKAILKDNPDCEIILETMNPVAERETADRPELNEYYQIYRDYALANNLELIDYYAKWTEVFNNDPSLYDEYIPDGVHPNEEGTEEVIMPVLEEYLF